MTRRVLVTSAVFLVASSSCRDTELPPPPGPGTVSGRVVRSVPGWAQPLAAEGATLETMGTSSSVIAGEDGRFVIDGLLGAGERLWIRYDSDGDGVVDLQRILSLASLNVGPGRHVALGDVMLGKNARVEGSVRISSRADSDTGHAGTSVVIKGTSFSAFSADNGTFALDALPPGELELVFYRAGFTPVVLPIELTSGQRLALQVILLDPSSDLRPAEALGAVQGPGGALEGARVKLVGATQLTEVTTAADGAWKASGLAPGLYNLGFEAANHTSLALPGVVLLPGTNQLATVTLRAGVSMPVVVPTPPSPPDASVPDDAGVDGGADAGPADAGFDAGAPDAGDFDAGPTDAGTDSGVLDAGQDAGVPDAGIDAGAPDAGPPLDCAGACSAGFACSTRISCETNACALVSCAGACRDGRCFANHCPSVTCAPGEVCDQGQCTALACAGKTCPALSQCANGRCVSNLCTNGPCPANEVCSNGACTSVRCVDVDCGAGRMCVAGQCVAAGPSQGCAPGAVFISGRCVDLSCEGVSCPAGSFCQSGSCTASGLFAAGLLYPNARTDLAPAGAIFTSSPTGWHRINVTALPRVLQLLISRDGQWLFALTDDAEGGDVSGSVWRSTDGVTWLRSWSGDFATSGAANAIAIDHVTGALFVALVSNISTSVIVSRDDGATWQTAFITPDFVGIHDRVYGLAPGIALVPFSNYGNSGVYLYDAGIKYGYYSPNTPGLLLSDPTGWGETYVSDSQLRTLDGGILAPIGALTQAAALYDEAPSRRVHIASATAIWFSNDGQSGWGQRSLPNGALRLTALARASDGVLYASNAGAAGGSPLLQSFDDGVTWNPISETWRRTPELVDGVEQWRPDASYSYPMRVQPSTPNGWYYEKWGPTQQLTVEPAWTTDGGMVIDPGNFISWNPLGKLDSRITALVSRACSVGQQRCGAACVNITNDPMNCGGCGITCATSCQLGRCTGPVDAGAASGCADGTREGFIDQTQWPNVAACAGAWTGAITTSSADSLCGANFHVCEPTDLELRAVTADDALAFPGCFAYRASNDGFDGCEPLVCSGDPAHDDMAGVGRTCLSLNGVAHRGDGGITSCLAGGARFDATCCAASVNGAGCQQTTQSGVVCCHD
ncbi:MAG: carboxypeptidase regulatory-like domain-containing protein [Myxococcaceae bacterium]